MENGEIQRLLTEHHNNKGKIEIDSIFEAQSSNGNKALHKICNLQVLLDMSKIDASTTSVGPTKDSSRDNQRSGQDDSSGVNSSMSKNGRARASNDTSEASNEPLEKKRFVMISSSSTFASQNKDQIELGL